MMDNPIHCFVCHKVLKVYNSAIWHFKYLTHCSECKTIYGRYNNSNYVGYGFYFDTNKCAIYNSEYDTIDLYLNGELFEICNIKIEQSYDSYYKLFMRYLKAEILR